MDEIEEVLSWHVTEEITGGSPITSDHDKSFIIYETFENTESQSHGAPVKHEQIHFGKSDRLKFG